MQLIRSPWAKVFSDFGRTIHSEAIVASPFIGAGPLMNLAAVLNPERPPRIDLITNLAVDSLLHGTVDAEAIAEFSRVLPDVTVRNLPGLHAKVYVADDNLAILTSGNMTHSSLCRNYEYGVQITDRGIVRQVAADIREYSSLGTEVSLSELEEIAEITLRLRSKYNAILRSARQQAQRELQDELQATQDALHNLRAKSGESENSIFTRTIMHILKQGALSTAEMHPIIEEMHPDLCDNSVFRVINGVRHGRRWKHMVRRSQQHLRTRGMIDYTDGKWHIV